MNPYRRNVLLGATVIVALAGLGWMILQFADSVSTVFGPSAMHVQFVADRADGVADGSPILYRGVESGHVTRVWLDPNGGTVHIEGTVNAQPALPANVKALIKTASLLGSGSAIALEATGEPSSEHLKENAQISASFIGLGDVLPTQFSDLATELTATIRRLRESGLVDDLDLQIRNVGKLVDSMNSVMGDPKTQENLKASLANMRDVTESAKTIATKLDKFADDLKDTNAQAQGTINQAGKSIESLSRQMGDRLTQIATLLDQFQSISQKVNNGQGTAGALVNDPKLYQSLVDTSRELNATIKDFKRLVEQWEQEGVTLKLK